MHQLPCWTIQRDRGGLVSADMSRVPCGELQYHQSATSEKVCVRCTRRVLERPWYSIVHRCTPGRYSTTEGASSRSKTCLECLWRYSAIKELALGRSVSAAPRGSTRAFLVQHRAPIVPLDGIAPPLEPRQSRHVPNVPKGNTLPRTGLCHARIVARASSVPLLEPRLRTYASSVLGASMQTRPAQ